MVENKEKSLGMEKLIMLHASEMHARLPEP
jgi:hypothetical protein